MTNRIGPLDQSMIGKIGNKIEEAGTTSRVSSDKDAKSGVGTAPESKGDTVNLTSSAQLLERLEKSLQSLPSVDAQRVAEIKTAIENGDYEINSKAIAEAMVRFERSLGE
ncbi:MAG: flagellar biosynthesis anti-sigma factor FlgM [Woeseiaceae bacterium]|nr:flagellar biosynthesis anti-sigma factor FlgM [Woeseiaceae bacterium]